MAWGIRPSWRSQIASITSSWPLQEGYTVEVSVSLRKSATPGKVRSWPLSDVAQCLT